MSAPFIPITGVGGDWALPGAFAEIVFAQGPASAAADVREVVLVMPKTSSGTFTVNTLYPITSEIVARNGAGTGSPAHRAARKFLLHNKDAKLSMVVYAATSGGSPATATSTLTFAGTVTAAGTDTVIVAGERCDASYIAAATATQRGDAMVSSINGKEWLPVTASNASGTVTLTAKIAGASQGTATIAVINVHVETTAGTGATLTSTGALGSAVAGADGTTTEAANLATALATLDNVRKYYMGVSVGDATGLGNLKTHIVTKSEPLRGLRSTGVAAFTGTVSNGITLATGRNYERLQIVWQRSSEHDYAELVGAFLAILQKEEAKDTACNINGYSLADIIQPAYTADLYPSPTDLNDAILGGLVPIASSTSGASIVTNTTTRSKNAGGTVNDPRARKRHRVSVCDEFVDEELKEFKLNYASKKLRADELLADGKINPNTKLVPNVITPFAFGGHIKARMQRFFDAGKLENVEASKQSLRCMKNDSRLEVGFDLDVIEHLDQATYRAAEVSTG